MVLCASVLRSWVQYLVRELRAHNMAKNKIKLKKNELMKMEVSLKHLRLIDAQDTFICL